MKVCKPGELLVSPSHLSFFSPTSPSSLFNLSPSLLPIWGKKKKRGKNPLTEWYQMKLYGMYNDVMDWGMARLGLGSGINNVTSNGCTWLLPDTMLSLQIANFRFTEDLSSRLIQVSGSDGTCFQPSHLSYPRKWWKPRGCDTSRYWG